jgi:hypothetical protein
MTLHGRDAVIESEHGPRGRWAGKLTRRPLPLDDPEIDQLSPSDRRALAGIWQSRAAMERRVADAFSVIRRALSRRAAPAVLQDLAERAIDDELRHAELSRVVASRFAGVELAPPQRSKLVLPRHAGASPELRDTLFIVGHCLFNETTASAFLETSLGYAQGRLAQCALRELLSDEIDHGRIGWAHLASLPDRERALVGPWLFPMAFLNVRTWREHSPPTAEHSDGLARHGAPPWQAVEETLLETLRVLIVPGLAELGLPTRDIEQWLAEGGSTA